MKNLYPFLNPVEWIKARNFAKKQKGFDKSSYDLELYLYSKLLTNNMLHYGYFDDINIRPETISFKQFEDAQIKYAENIIELVNDKDSTILDVGCGMGGLSQMLSTRNFEVESLTPNVNQIEFIAENYDHLITHNCKFEDFESGMRFGSVINSESLQYISLKQAFEKTNAILHPGGKWIICDYFSLDKVGENQRPHYFEDFVAYTNEHNWTITHQRDITPNILPTLTYIDMYVDRFLLPVKHFAYEKLKFKKPKLYYLSHKIRDSINKKIEKETKTVSPSWFVENRKYMLIVLEKPT